MKDTKLVSLLKNLTTEDLRQIRKMLISPFYTTNSNLLALFNLLRTYHPAYESGKLEKRIVFRKLFPKHDYSDIKLRNLNSELVRIIEDYLIYREVKSNDYERRKKLARIYRNSGHSDWFERETRKLSEELNKLPFRDQDYYKEMLDLTILNLEYYEGKKMDHRFDMLEEWENLLDNYYELSKARHHLALKNLNRIIKPTESHSELSNLKQNIQWTIYQQFDELFLSGDLNLFERLCKQFEQHILRIRPKYQKEILKMLINFAIKQMAVDDTRYNQVVLDLYKLGLKHQLIFFDKAIVDTAFFNIVVCASKAKDFDWVIEFMEQYESQLSTLIKDDIKTHSLSTYYFHKEEYSKAVDLIKSHRFRHEQIKTVGRNHAIRCYYELYLLDTTYYEVLIAQIESNERYLRRLENLPEEKLTTGLNFLNFIRKLATMRLAGKLKPGQQEDLLEELAHQEITLSRSWLTDILKR